MLKAVRFPLARTQCLFFSTHNTQYNTQTHPNQAAALLLAEVWLVGSAAAGASVMDIGSLKRLLFDVFHEDVGLFKEYCLQVGCIRDGVELYVSGF